jgi:hypothetical protein
MCFSKVHRLTEVQLMFLEIDVEGSSYSVVPTLFSGVDKIKKHAIISCSAIHTMQSQLF